MNPLLHGLVRHSIYRSFFLRLSVVYDKLALLCLGNVRNLSTFGVETVNKAEIRSVSNMYSKKNNNIEFC